MSEKRKNGAILGLVALLLIGSVALYLTRDFRLGLDLRGGLEVVLEARPEAGQTVSDDALEQAADIMAQRIDPQGILSPEIRTSPADDQISIAVPGIEDPRAAAQLLVSTGQMQSFNLYKYLAPSSTAGQYQARPSDSLFDLLTRAARTVEDESTVEGWALFDRETERQLGRIEPQKAQVLEDISETEQPPGTVWRPVPERQQVVSCDMAKTQSCPEVQSTTGTWYYLFRIPPPEEVITGSNPRQVSADAQSDQQGQPIVSLSYREGGADEFARISQELALQGAAAGRPLPNAIVVDNELVSAPIIDYVEFPNGIDATQGGGSSITGMDRSEAERVALEIQSGSLPVSFTAISSNNVSATLGEDSLRNGLIAGAVGLAFVMVFLIVLYGFLGLIADLALLIYGVLLAGVVLAIPVTMTLPGIAGTILTIGVAADANIVIFERIKEEVRAGRSLRSAISAGYSKGFHTIIDANVVTLITAAVLYIAATSSVKGFALMLLIGVITSIFTAVVATRAMLSVLGGFDFMRSPRVLGTIGTGDRWTKYDLISRWRLWFGIAAAVVVFAVGSIAVLGLNQGIDFSGGSRFSFTAAQPQTIGDVRTVFEENGAESTVVKGIGEAVDGDRYRDFQVQALALPGEEQTQLVGAVAAQFDIEAGDIDNRNVSASFGEGVLRSALYAVAFSLLIIILYVSFRFEWKYSVPVIVALVHDIVITIGVYALTGREVTADTVAAILTVLGYSLYDTVIVFDRVRENVPLLRRATAFQVVNTSLAEVITRSLNTSVVTLIPVVFLYVFGSGSLVDFAFALLVGIGSGAYSSIFIAAPLLALLLEREPGFKKRRADLGADAARGTLRAPAMATAAVPAGGVDGGNGAAAAPAAAPAAADGGSGSTAAAAADGEQRRRRRRSRPHGRAR